jgi:hypothetical protein
LTFPLNLRARIFDDSRLALILALLLGIGSLALYYLVFSNPFSIAEFCGRNRPTWVLPLFQRPRYTAMTGLTFVLAYLGAVAAWIAAWRCARRVRGRLAAVLLVGVLPVAFAIVLVPAYPLLANDIYKYIFDGRIITEYGSNPFLHVPAEFPQDRFYDLVYWKAEVNAHGPLWRMAEAASAAIGGNDCDASVMAMKFWPTAAYLASVVVVYTIALRLWPQTALGDAVLYAWSPLVLLESLQNGHNDVVAALPSLVAVWLARSGRYRLAFPALAIAALVKPLALALGPLLLVAAVRAGSRPTREAVEGIVIGAALTLVSFAPFWSGPETLQGMSRSKLFTDSPAAALVRGLNLVGVPPETAMTAGSLMVQVLFGGAVLLMCAALWSRRLRLEAATCGVYLSYCLVGAQWFNPWYVLWFAPLLPLATGGVRHVSVAFMVLAPLLYALDPETLVSVAVIFIPSYLLVWRYRHALGWPSHSSPRHAASGAS